MKEKSRFLVNNVALHLSQVLYLVPKRRDDQPKRLAVIVKERDRDSRNAER